MSLTLTFLSLVFWAWVVGPLGAIPLTLLVKALLVDGAPQAQWIATLLAGRSPPPAEPTAPEAAPTAP